MYLGSKFNVQAIMMGDLRQWELEAAVTYIQQSGEASVLVSNAQLDSAI